MSTDEMPDFDSMSPEEMMKWMESLAKRQGATEGMTTSADMEVAEVDPDSVDESILSQKYVPHGWTEEKWEAHLAKEAEEKAAKVQAQPTIPEPPKPEPVVAAQPPAPTVSEPASADAGDDMPDFDSMSPEEMMKWMESLAVRQGATEGMTTSADMQVAEVDPDSVDESILSQKYVPHGWTEEKWEAHLAKEAEEKAAKAQAQPTIPESPKPIKETPTLEIPEETAFPDLSELEDETVPTMPDFMSFADMDIESEPAVTSPGDAMDWLADLASGQGDDDMPDLSGLADLSEPMPELDLSSSESEGDPMDWLASLASENDAPDLDLSDLGMDLPDMDTPPQPPAQPAVSGSPIDTGDDPMEWLESLAKRQGADDEELATSAGLDIPLPEGLQTDGPGYNPYSFEDPIGEALDEVYTDEAPTEPLTPEFDVEQMDFDDPEAWLDSLASGSTPASDFASLSPTPSPDLDSFFDEDDEEIGDAEDVDEVAVISRLNQGEEVSPEEIMGFFTQQFDKADEIAELEEAHDPEAEAVQAEIPDWLLDQMGSPPVLEDEPEEKAATDTYPAFVDEITEPSDADEMIEMPDWLQQNIEDAEPADDLSDIFDDAEPEPVAEPEPEPPAPEPVAAVETPVAKTDLDIDTNDPWVEAFVLENEQQGEMEAWYQQQVDVIEGGGTPVAVPETAKVAAEMQPLSPVTLQTAELPTEEDLPEGEPEALPDWLGVSAAASIAEAAPAAEEQELVPAEIPDWLQDVASEEPESDEMPDWLAETSEEESVSGEALPDWLSGSGVEPEEIPNWLLDTMDSQEVAVTEAPPEQPQVIQTPTPAPQPAASIVPQSPAPVPISVANIDVPATLNNARSKVTSGDVDGAMQEYEMVVRANAELDTVQKEISKLAEDKKHKNNPVVYRILGDTLMRQGKLQDALETYRKALNRL